MPKALIFFFLPPVFVFSQPLHPYTVPEYAQTQAVLIEWDFNTSTWSLYSDLITECQEAAEVICIVRDLNEENDMRQRLEDDGVPLANIDFVHVPCERMWVRDHGPFAVQTELGVAYLDFNDKASSGMDENLPTNLAQAWGLPAYERSWIFDGGNLLVDSYGTLFCNSILSMNAIPCYLAVSQSIGSPLPVTQIFNLFYAKTSRKFKTFGKSVI